MTVCSKIVENELQGKSPSLLPSHSLLLSLLFVFLFLCVFSFFSFFLYMSNEKQCWVSVLVLFLYVYRENTETQIQRMFSWSCTNLQTPVIVIIPMDPRRLIGLYAVAKAKNQLVLEFVARQRVDSHLPSFVEVGWAVFGQQHSLNLCWVSVGRLVVEGPVKGVVKRWDTTYRTVIQVSNLSWRHNLQNSNTNINSKLKTEPT